MATWQLARPRRCCVPLSASTSPSFSFSVKVLLNLHLTPHFFCLGVHLCSFSSRFALSLHPPPTENDRWVTQRIDKKVVCRIVFFFFLITYLCCQKLSFTHLLGSLNVILSSDVPALLTSQNQRRDWCKWDLVCDWHWKTEPCCATLLFQLPKCSARNVRSDTKPQIWTQYSFGDTSITWCTYKYFIFLAIDSVIKLIEECNFQSEMCSIYYKRINFIQAWRRKGVRVS